MTTNAPNPSDSGVQNWAPAEHAALVQSKGWKGVGDALKSYSELETFRGAPADRLIMLPDKPEKIDDAFRGDVFKRIGYNPNRGPAKPEDYGVQFEGAPPEFTAAISALAHKHGIPKEALAEFAALNADFGKKAGESLKGESDKTWAARQAAVDAKLKERFGDKFEEMNKKLGLEAMRVGGFKDAAELEAFERDLALGGDNNLAIWRGALADLAEVRREAPLHKDGGGGAMSAEQAKAALAAKGTDKEWVTKALTRGTPEAAENLRLNFIANGGSATDEELTRMAKGLTAQPSGG